MGNSEEESGVLKPTPGSGTLSTEAENIRSELVDLERQLTSLLVTVQRALGKEPTVMTRSERRKR
jgi:hypothetical protein